MSERTAATARAEGFEARSGALPSLANADIVVLAVADAAVFRLADALAQSQTLRPGAVVLHLAGSLDLTPLASLRLQGANTGSLHPLTSLATRTSNLAGTTCALDAANPTAESVLSKVAADLGVHVIRPTGDRAAYHAAACLVGNYPQVLLEAALRLFERAGIDRAEGQPALASLLESAARNAAQLGPAAGLTGPVKRGDADVVRRHLVAIAGTDRVEALYRAGAALATELVPDSAAAAVLSVLEGDE